jgi:hypothetical protein
MFDANEPGASRVPTPVPTTSSVISKTILSDFPGDDS